MHYPELAALLGGYLHQDWDLEQDSLEGVLDSYVSVTDQPAVRAAAAEARRFNAEHPVGLLAAFEREFRADIIIGQDDEQARAWLDWLAAGLDSRLGPSG